METMVDCGPTARELLTRLSSPVRNRYYYGKLLDVYHLDVEQSYGNLKRWMLNRLSLGTGVLCGLDVSVSADKKQVRVSAGVAIDGWGREIIVPSNSPGIDVMQPTDDCGRNVGDPVRTGIVTLWVCYHECEAEPSPAFVSDCPDSECENGLVRERYRLRISSGRGRPPVSHVDCAAAFAGPGTYANRRRTFCQTIDDRCDSPGESCVPIALIEIGDGLVQKVDTCIVRPVVYSNAVLLDLIICLANRVDECCGELPPPVQTMRIDKVSGDNQPGTAGQLAPAPLVAVVTQGGTNLFNEPVTFAVASGGGSIGATPATLAATITVNTDASGNATLPAWKFGPAAGAQSVTASITSGSPSSVMFTAKVGQAPVERLPVVNTIWPSNGMKVSLADPAARDWYEQPRLEITFSNKMNVPELDKPETWLKLFSLRFDARKKVVQVRPLPLSHAPPVVAPKLPGPGFCETFQIDQVASDTLIGTKMLVLMRATGGNIEDTSSPALTLDADFAGTKLSTIPVAAGAAWAQIFALSATKTFPQVVWDSIVSTGAMLPKSGNNTQGGDFDSFFLPVRD
jgi:hypothetical protein